MKVGKSILAFLMLAGWSGVAFCAEDDFPARPIRMIVPAAAGTGTDGLTRAFIAEAVERIKQPLVVENIAGGGPFWIAHLSTCFP